MRLSLRARLLVTSVGLLAVGLALSGAAFFGAADTIIRTSTRDHLRARTGELLEAVRRHHSEKFAAVMTWAEAEAMQSSIDTGEPKFAEDYLRRVIQDQSGAIGFAALLDLRGQVITAVRPGGPGDAGGKSVAGARGKEVSASLVVEAARSGTPSSGLVREGLPEELMAGEGDELLAIQPVKDFTGDPVGVLIATISRSGLEHLLSTIVGDDPSSFLPVFFDTDRRYVVGLRGRSSPDLLARLDLAQSGGARAETLSTVAFQNEGYLAISVARPAGEVPRWAAATFVSERRALGPLRRLLVYLPAGFLVILACMGALSAVGLERAAKPLTDIAASMIKVADGNFNAHIQEASDGALGGLVRAFNLMVTEVARARSNLEAINASIEQQVVDRTKELHASREQYRSLVETLDVRNRDLRLVLDTADQGFMIASLDGTLASEHSLAIEGWLGPVKVGMPVWDYFGAANPAFGAELATGWQNLQDGILAAADVLDALPRRLEHRGRQLQFGYKSIASTQGVMVVVSDITAQIAQEESESAQRELVQIFQGICKDREGFLEFFAEGQELVKKIGAEPPTLPPHEIYRAVHTLKGNASLFGVSSVAHVCHEVEERLKQAGSELGNADRRRLLAAWETSASMIDEFLGEKRATAITIDQVEYLETLAAVRDGVNPGELVRRLEGWKHESAGQRLTRIAEQATALAHRLGKGSIAVTVNADRVRLPQAQWAEFWACFSHVVRNAVDHGLEEKEQRLAEGKPEQGSIQLSIHCTADQLQLTIADDGRGISWEALRHAAKAAGLPAETREQLTHALFVDGITTKTTASGISGRGVGMGAVRAACQKIGGTIHLTSQPGRGTQLEFRFPHPGA